MSMHPPQPDELGAQTRLDIRPTPWPWWPLLTCTVLAAVIIVLMVIGGWFG